VRSRRPGLVHRSSAPLAFAAFALLAVAPSPAAARPFDAIDVQLATLVSASGGRPDLEVRAPASRWRRTAGPAALTAGGMMLAGGLTLSMVSRQLASDLRNRAAAQPLGATGGAAYRRLDRLNGAATGLCIIGGVTATLGAWLWLTAPDLSTDVQPINGGFLVQYRGRF